MKYLNFRILAFCILYPPILYIISIQYATDRMTVHFQKAVEEVAVGDMQPLFSGTADIEKVIPANINRFLENQPLNRWGLNLKITVTSKGGRVLFPPPYGEFNPDQSPANPIDIAAENYKILTEGLNISVEANLRHNRLLTNFILFSLILSAILILYLHIRSGARKAAKDEAESAEALNRLESLRNETKRQLYKLEADHQNLTSKFHDATADLENQRNQTHRNEDEFIEEIDALEKKLADNLSFQEELLELIETHKMQIEALEKEQERVIRLQKKGADEIGKRFNTLYKRLSFNPRFIDDFLSIPDDHKLKAEEVILQLHENPDQVSIKRKVFTKKNKETVLEVTFAYRGRLYFRRLKDGKIELLVIGNKNSQNRDLEFINNL